MTAAEVAARLGLQPHREGGYFKETYRSPVIVPTPTGARCLATSILYLLTAASPSRFHRLRFDEVWFYHSGAQAEMFLLGGAPGRAPGGVRVSVVERRLVGPGEPQTVVPGGSWMAARVGCATEGEAAPEAAADRDRPDWTLVGCAVSPGFEYADFELGGRQALLAAYPQAAELIHALT